jgi:hypothetical protein
MPSTIGAITPVTGLREDLADVIHVIDAKNTPISSAAKKGADLTNAGVFSYQADSYNEPVLDGVLSNADVTSFDDPTKNRVLLSARGQKLRRSIKVDDFVQNVNDTAGVGKRKEMARAISRSLVEIKRDIESVISSDAESQEQSGASPYKTRGLGKWILSSAASDLPVPVSQRTPAASINTTATASLTESEVQTLLQSIYTQTGNVAELTLVCGPALKRKFTEFTRFSTGSAGAGLSVRTFTNSADSKSIISVVNFFEGDFGSLSLLPSLFLAKDNASADVQNARGYVLDMSMIELRYGRRPRYQELEDMGGGPRGLVDAIVALSVGTPKGLGKFAATS